MKKHIMKPAAIRGALRAAIFAGTALGVSITGPAWAQGAPGSAGAPAATGGATTNAAVPVATKRNLAPGFTTRAADSRLLVVPVDMELFSLSAGGVPEPRADWTQAAQKNFGLALDARRKTLGTQTATLSESDLDDIAELNALHGAVATAIFRHHSLGALQLPTKKGVLDWSMGDAVQPLRQKTGADYALFTFVRDSYASAERKAAIVMMAMLGVGLTGGFQVGYASLVDLRDGRVVWFNHLLRGTGDLREAESAKETVNELLRDLPDAK
jgi:hypothetical protein